MNGVRCPRPRSALRWSTPCPTCYSLTPPPSHVSTKRIALRSLDNCSATIWKREDCRTYDTIGSDERVYEGRGWNSKPGEHEKHPGLFERCVEFAYIGNYDKKEPPIAQQRTAWALLEDAAYEVKITPRMSVTEEYYEKGLTEELERKYSVKYKAEREAKERAETKHPVDENDLLTEELERLYNAQTGI